MPAPESIRQLVARFTDQRDIYRSGKYNETQLRNDFLDPFFEALGWDVNNRKNYSEKFREVVKEVSVDVDGTAKAADYAFQSGGHVHFFVEAKKPAVNIESHPDSAFQIRRYGWSKKLNVSLLSDFEQLAVYDCRQKPVHGDPAYTSRTNLYSFTEYIDKWDEIAALLSYEAVHQGSLEKFTDSLKGKRGTADVDDAFLAEMEHWREELARVIALRNASLTQREINTAVQLIIDRIIFLRICEDRGIEPENGLRDATDGIDVYGDLMELFKKADKKYNSGLFHFDTEKGQSSHPDTLTSTLKIDDKVFKDILANLYLPKSPYAFNYFSAEILGQVYERFLGKVIRLTAGGHAKVEEKPEVRKAGGVYYTPTYIVDYIVKNTVGELLNDKTPADLEADPIRIVDPACGSGSFLLGAYQFLLDWCLNWYIEHDPSKWSRGKNPPIFEGDQGWQLTMQTKKALLTRHIFGVDIDAQAVEVTKLSLLLKVVENPGQLDLFGDRILPDLGENIKCGNSLIGPDYYDNQQLTMFDSEERYRVNAFDWHKAFPKAFTKGGFDAVIGNPPYVFGGNFGIEDDSKKYFSLRFLSGSGKVNLFGLFIEKSIEILRHNALLAFIIPNTLLRVTSYAPIREYMLSKSNIGKIVDLGVGVFEGATTSSIIIVLEKNSNPIDNVIKISHSIDGVVMKAKQRDFLTEGFVLNINATGIDNEIIQKMLNCSVSLGDLCDELIFGVVITKNRDKVVSEEPLPGYKPFLEGKDIGRYQIYSTEKYLLYDPKQLHRPRTPEVFEVPEKILIQRITGGLSPLKAAYDDKQYYNKESINNIIIKKSAQYNTKFILGLLNSQFINWFYRTRFTNSSNLTVNLSKEYLSQIPIKKIDFTKQIEVKIHDRMVNLVETMLNLHKLSAAARLPDEKERLARQIESTDHQIDKLVYELYNLTPDEIKIVEGA